MFVETLCVVVAPERHPAALALAFEGPPTSPKACVDAASALRLLRGPQTAQGQRDEAPNGGLRFEASGRAEGVQAIGREFLRRDVRSDRPILRGIGDQSLNEVAKLVFRFGDLFVVMDQRRDFAVVVLRRVVGDERISLQDGTEPATCVASRGL